jgi:redox-sensitive bicupin YhaK (pirin superfamily)
VHQDAFVYVAALDPQAEVTQPIEAGRGGYLYLIGGRGLLNGRSVSTGDAAKITGPEKVTFSAEDPSELILVEVPLRFEAVGVWRGR